MSGVLAEHKALKARLNWKAYKMSCSSSHVQMRGKKQREEGIRSGSRLEGIRCIVVGSHGHWLECEERLLASPSPWTRKQRGREVGSRPGHNLESLTLCSQLCVS